MRCSGEKRKNKCRPQSPGNLIRAATIRFLKIRGEPREIALGLALGIMVGMTPLMGLHTVIAVFLAAVWKWNKIAAAGGVFITNPLTAPFVYPVTYIIGHALVGVSSIPRLEIAVSLETIANLFKDSPLILVDLMAGGIIIGLPLSIAAYWITMAAVENYRRKIQPKPGKRRGRLAVNFALKPHKQMTKGSKNVMAVKNTAHQGHS